MDALYILGGTVSVYINMFIVIFFTVFYLLDSGRLL